MEVFDYLRTLLQFTIGLITILNPIAAAAIMVSLLTPPVSKRELVSISKKTTLTILTASLLSTFLGDLIFKLFDINIHSIKVIGGIILLLFSINMIKGKIFEASHTPEEHEEAKEKDDISIIPLGIPILFGPGTFTTLVIFKTSTHNWIDLFILITAIFISSVVVFLVFKNAVLLDKFLGITGVKITTRIMGLIVGAIASQFIVSGVKSLWDMY
ncbi:MarC family protein [Hydrogenivirga sp. 128-5-R1-1]|uniref:MarC family protein n=1 Tax=Hydrogenivirga sp. 128-5-R1-1 TaxID=392423 RepID=UPI00015F1169|nr:MarC family protein [Hydrogenivirga sp. 128-5-R1-1]EDP74377.1 Multiple antibiotic resistance (MarC)-related protein [Hydrogenivirga sp. 128-5-R1-1]